MTATPINFACVACGKRYHAPADAAGRTVDCKRCGAELTIPKPRPTIGHDENLVGFHCPLCATRMHAPVDQIGQPTTCPDCHKVFPIPPPPKRVVRQRKAVLDREAYDLDDSDSHAEEAPGADESLFEHYAKRPPVGYRSGSTKPAKAPRGANHGPATVLTRQFAYWRSPGVLGVLLALSALATLAAVCGGATLAAVAGWSVGVRVSIAGLFPLMAFGLLTSVSAFVALSAYVSAALAEAAEGAPHVQRWPPPAPTEWFGPAVRCFAALACVVALGGAIASVAGLTETAFATTVAITLGVGLPWAVLSQMETGSTLGVFSPALTRTLWHAPLAWLLFYAQSAAGVAALAATAAALADSVAPAAVLLLTPIAVIGLMHGAWMLGLVAWCAHRATAD